MQFSIVNESIQIRLPITQPTSMVRVKTRTGLHKIGEPVAARQTLFNLNMYLEWQIAYDTLDVNLSNSGVSFERVKLSDGSRTNKYLFELSEYLLSALNLNFFDISDLHELIQFSENVLDTEYIESNLLPVRTPQGVILTNKCPFSIYHEELPIVYLSSNSMTIEMMVKHKQRAVGNQTMVFLAIPINLVDQWENLQGRQAVLNEHVTLTINNQNAGVLIDLCKCFMFASRQHNQDIRSILHKLTILER